MTEIQIVVGYLLLMISKCEGSDESSCNRNGAADKQMQSYAWHENQDNKAVSERFSGMSVRTVIKPIFKEVSACRIRIVQLDKLTSHRK